MGINLNTLLGYKSADQIYNDMLAGVAAAGVRVANWRTGGPYRTLLRVTAVITEQLYKVSAAFAAAGFLDLSEGDWLTLLCKSLFSEDRAPALFTSGVVTLTAAQGSGPYTISAGSLIVGTGGGLRYRSTGTVTVPAGGSTDVEITAESPGVKYNVGLGALDKVISPTLAGLSVSNPSIINGGSILAAGADEESDARLRTRCKAKWATLGTGSPASAYVNWALTASAEVANVGVASNLLNGAFTPQAVTVVVAGSGGAVSDAAVLAVKNFITPKVPTTTVLAVEKAQTRTVPVTAVIYVRAARDSADTRAAVVAGLDSLARSIPIGGSLYLSQIVSTIQDTVPGAVRNSIVTAPTTDVILTYRQVLNFSYTLTWQVV